MRHGNGFEVLMIVLGAIGIVWALVDVVDDGAGNVAGSTWVAGALGIVLIVTAVYRMAAGGPIVTVNPDHESPAQQFEEQKRRDGLA